MKHASVAKLLAITLGFGLLVLLFVVLSPSRETLFRTRNAEAHRALEAPARESNEPEVTLSDQKPARADDALHREGRSPIAGGFLVLPPSFSSETGDYDLVVHFHGNADLVEESYKLVELNAAVLILNYGNGSGVYEDRFANPAIFADILGRVGKTLEKRGLAHPSQRRLALSAWSAGYGAILRILEHEPFARMVDAVLLFDGIHCGYKPGTHEPYLAGIAPFVRFAEQATHRNKLFSITHSNITPVGNYAGTRVATDALLRELGVPRERGGEEPPIPPLASLGRVMPKKLIAPLVPESEAHKGGLMVRGYTGTQAQHHNMHLVQMSVTAIPDLVESWREPQAP